MNIQYYSIDQDHIINIYPVFIQQEYERVQQHVEELIRIYHYKKVRKIFVHNEEIAVLKLHDPLEVFTRRNQWARPSSQKGVVN